MSILYTVEVIGTLPAGISQATRVFGGPAAPPVEPSFASFPEVFLSPTSGLGTSGSFALATPLEASDVVVIVASNSGLASNAATVTVNASAPSLLGSWSLDASSDTHVQAYSSSGHIGATFVEYLTPGTVTYSFSIFVVRGLATTDIAIAASDWSATVTPLGTDEGTAPMAAKAGQGVIALAAALGGTVTFPSNPTPADGWVTDLAVSAAVGRHGAAHLIVTADGDVQVNIQTTLNRVIGVVALLLG